MCNCLKEAERKTYESMKELIEKDTDVHQWISGQITSKTLLMGKNGGWVPSLTFEVEYTRRKKNGEPENGRKKKSVQLLCTYCPFCGEKRAETSANE